MVESHIRNSSLAHSRLVAAKASGGTSGEDIYRLFDRVVGDLVLKGALLDFGAGIGALSSRLHRKGRFSRLTAVDILPRPTDLPSSVCWICADLNDVLPFGDCSFDVIVAAEVIEHLENPRFVARECHRLLRRGGWLILSTPNNESFRSILALLFRGHYTHFGEKSYPAHITALLRKDLERILTEAGFATPCFHYTNVGMLPKLRYSWQQLSFGFLTGLRFTDNVMAIAQKSL